MQDIHDKIAKDYWHKKAGKVVHSEGVFPENLLSESAIAEAQGLSYFYKLTGEKTVAEFTVLSALYAMLLQRYFEDSTLLSSKPFLPGAKNLLCYSFGPIAQKTVREFIQETKQEVEEVYTFAPFCEAAFTEQISGINHIPFQFNYGTTNDGHVLCHGLSFHIEKLENKDLKISANYAGAFVDRAIVGHFVMNFKKWLQSLETNIHLPIASISILSEGEKEQLLGLNPQKGSYDTEMTLAGLVEEQAQKTPQDIAVVCQQTAYTYASLNEMANRLSHFLIREKNISEGDFVGVKMERSEKLLIAILAVLKAGATYVPIDVNYPEERIAYIEKDSNCTYIIDADAYEGFLETYGDYSTENPLVNRQSNDLAYIIYTSGTTGNPKGVMITHQNAVALIHWAREEFRTESFDILYAATSHCFDLSVYEMFYPLSVGKKIRILANALEIGAALTSGQDQKILINTVPSSIRNVLEAGISLENVSVINLAGEPFPVDIAKKLLQTNAEIRNLYGPSEDTTYSTSYRLSAEKDYQSIPVGKPIFNTQAYILDDERQLVPAGNIGKLYLSGDGIAQGYLNQSELTAAKFIDNPFDNAAKMYDTGDLAKWMPDGNLAFFGRKDHQVKLRGYRIELGEIENVILSFSATIQQAVVAVKKNKEDVLVGYYVENTPTDKTLLRKYLEKQLPGYMVPTHFVKVDAIPLTPNGKVNKEALPEIADIIMEKTAYVAPADSVEEVLVAIWEQTLGVSPIGMNDHFFELGGHSLMISQVINSIYKKLNKSVPYKVFYTNPTLSDLRKVLKDQEYLPIPSVPVADSYPLTPSQNRLWLLSQLEGGNAAYQISGAVTLKGTVDGNHFIKAFEQVVARHEILRTVFRKDEEGIVQQYCIPEEDFHFTIETGDFSNAEFPDLLVREYIREKDTQSYRLDQAPLFRASLLKTATEEYVFYLSIHHLISDGWSLKVMTSQVLECYDALQSGKALPLSGKSIQFKDYAAWLASEQQKENYRAAKEFWLAQFQETVPVLQLPGYSNRPSVKTYHGNQYRFAMPAGLLASLKSLSKESGVTLFTVLMAGVKILLSRYSNQDDIVIGTPVAGREHPDLEHQIGLYINTLALRTSINPKETFSALLQRAGKQLLTAYGHQSFPFDALVEQLKTARDTSRSPLFDVMVVLQNQHQVSGFTNTFSSGVVMEDLAIDRNVSPFDMVFTFIEKETLQLELLYNSDVYTPGFIEGIAVHLEQLFTQIVKTPEIQLEEIELVSETEKELLLDTFNTTDTIFDTGKTIIDLFLEQVSKTPQNTAIVANGEALSYAGLDELSNKLAHYLILNYKIGQHDVVAVLLERGERLLIALLGILKAGAAYVPIDSNYPENRIKDILQDVSGKIVVDDAFMDDFYCEEELPSVVPELKTESTDLAYIIYTSGSTGKPKGVMITHQSLANLCFWHKEAYGVDQTSKGTLFSGVAFDASVWEIYPYLVSGATLYPIQNEDIRLQTSLLASFLKTNEITHTYLPSKICQEMMAEEDLELKTIILTGGESLNYATHTSLQVYNNYGPTENTVVTTYYDCKKAVKEKVSIGKPVSNTKVYILSDNLKLQPVGVIGELCISGAGLSKGYWQQPALTAEKFIPNPFSATGKLYKTGDLARWLPDGNLEFIGRKDNQVKIRGNRVELAEIEHVIREYGARISDVLVDVKEVYQEQAIVAYYTASETIDKKELRDYLKELLPDYMVPGYYVALEKLPLNANGKVDRIKLPAPSQEDILKKEYVAPGNETEAKIVGIWQELLGHQAIGVTDDFFELGGHSLLLTKLLNEYQKAFKAQIDLKILYSNTSLKSHAVLLQDAATVVQEIKKTAPQEYYEISPSQMRYWLLYKIQGKSREFNIYSTFELPEHLNTSAFATAFNLLLERHEVLRSVFAEEAGIPKQKILPHQTMPVPFLASEEEGKKEVFGHAFDLETYPLFKIAIVKEGQNHTLFFNIHHSISDGWSMGIISRDLMALYAAVISGNTAGLPQLDIQYKEYAQWQNGLLQPSVSNVPEHYWKEKLSGTLPYLPLPSDYTAKLKNNEANSSSYTVYVTQVQQQKIETLFVKKGISAFAVFVATLKIMLFRLTSEEDIIVGIPVANRNHYQLKDLVGCFINTVMLRDTIAGTMSFNTWLQQVNETLVNALVHQNYPFEQLLELLNVPQKDNRFPISPVFLNMVDFDVKTLETITDFSPSHEVLEAAPKFDIECYIKSFANGYSINCVYDHELFKPETITYWMDAYLSVIDQVTANEEKQISEITLFDQYIEQEAAARPTNDFDFFEAAEIEQSIAARFEKKVAQFPNHTAVYANDTVLTYHMLNNCANHLAQQILEKAQEGTRRIALLLSHNETCVIGMMGVLKAGFAYVPIDANSPVNRIRYIMEDSGCSQLICNSTTEEKTRLLQEELPYLSVIKLPESYVLPEMENLENSIKPSDEAYVLYTSGSTGMPKGVLQNQRNVLHFIRVYTNNVHIAVNDNLSVFSTYTFDASVKDIYGAILNGATVSIYDITENGLDKLSEWLFTQNITIIHMVPTIYRNFLKGLEENEVLTTVRLVDLGGESCHKPDLDLFREHFTEGAFLVNDYGPTESTIVAQNFLNHASKLTRNNMPLGKTVQETSLFLWDKNNQPLGVYQEGEIVFKSDYLSLGYLNRQELTEQVFLTDPATGKGRVYKSGDIGKMLPSGEIEFLQRKDSQVKLNGLRIELSEIEYQLEQIEAIKEAVVLLKEMQGNSYITAYIRVSETLGTAKIKALLAEILPKYMIPALYITLEEFPMTRTGKIERKALPDPTISDLKTVPYVAPQNDIESKLAAIWSEVLKLDIGIVGTEDNFFELGGNSLQGVVLINKINKNYNTSFSIANLYETLTIKDLSALLHFSLVQNQEFETADRELDQDEIIL
ncbi:non-ribosomal peptide synthetase [Flavobacterium humi]|uniref:Amino acid adenylation domain-containing protein n=1 Tax=Flavobacterium humi TaxID=2562683 RepID=A0A4Z0L902_9FLAO|nr:non-ribosomal peptide synthetase [Flavobacterium humi]TGD58748.1 amino acid adenylation domain-containing protein [Flavobacterium humi]